MTRARYNATVTAAVLATAVVALAGNGTPINSGSANELTIAAYGDTPYRAGQPTRSRG